MATSNFITSISIASDELYDFNCSVCAEGSITKEAVNYCKDCNEYFCEGCLQQHNRFPKMRSHLVTDTTGQVDDSRTHEVGSQEDVPKCVVHHGNDVIKFCQEHEAPCCKSCIAFKHRSCNSTIDIMQAAKNITNNSEYRKSLATLHEVLTSLKEEKRKTQDSLTSVQLEKRKELNSIDLYQKELHAKINEKANTSKQRINTEYLDVEVKLNTNISTLDTAVVATEQVLQNISSENEVKTFVYMTACSNVIKECQELLQELTHQAGWKQPVFNQNKDIINTLDRQETLLQEDVQYRNNKDKNKKVEVDDKCSPADYQRRIARECPEYLENIYQRLWHFEQTPSRRVHPNNTSQIPQLPTTLASQCPFQPLEQTIYQNILPSQGHMPLSCNTYKYDYSKPMDDTPTGAPQKTKMDPSGFSNASTERSTKILVSKIPSTAHEDLLELFFENTNKYGGGPVLNIELDEDDASAVIEFEDPDAVDRVLAKRPIKMMGQEVDVQIYVPEPPPPRCTIEVTGPPDVVSEDQLSLLEMYFENERCSGGGAVVKALFDADKNMALITFETENVAMRVAERGNHVIKRQNIGVKLHTPETKLKKRTKPEAKEEVADMYQEEQPICTVKIKGVDKAVSRDTLVFYFENERRSGGGEIDDIRSDEEEEDVLYVTFKKAEVAKRVAEKVHSFEDQNLKATLFVLPKLPPCYHDRVIIKGFNPSTTQDCLFNFIEAKSGLIPDKMDYHAELEGVAMVTFFQMEQEQDLVFNTLERVFSNSKLEGASLKIARVPVSNCILVSNLASDVTKDTVEFYFESEYRSGGGQVQKVVMNDDESCLVFFQDYSVIDRVLHRQHIVSKQTLDVMRFQECLCKPEGEHAERKLRKPEAIFLPDVDRSKIKFMKASKANKQAIEAQLQTCNTAIVWPRQQENVILQCTITSETQNCYKLVKSWRENAQRNFEDFMKLITVHKVPILQEVWQNVMDELKTVTIEKPDAVSLFVDKSDGILTIVGNKPVSDSLAKRVNDITKKVLEEAERERQKGKYIAKGWWGKSKERN